MWDSNPAWVLDPSEFAWMESACTPDDNTGAVPNPCAGAVLKALETHPVSSDAVAAFHATRVRMVLEVDERPPLPHT